MLFSLNKLNGAILAGSVLVALAPGVAAACPAPDAPSCQALDFWFELTPTNAAAIPADGVVVLRGRHHGGADEPWLDIPDRTPRRKAIRRLHVEWPAMGAAPAIP